MAQMKPEHSSDLKSKWPQWKQIKWCPQAIPVRYYVLAGKADHVALRIKNNDEPRHQITTALMYRARHCTKRFIYTPLTGNHYGPNIRKRRSRVSNPWPPDSKTCPPTQIVQPFCSAFVTKMFCIFYYEQFSVNKFFSDTWLPECYRINSMPVARTQSTFWSKHLTPHPQPPWTEKTNTSS